MKRIDWRASLTRAVVIAGRQYDISDLTVGEAEALAADIEAQTPWAAVPIDADLTDESGPMDDEPAYCSMLVGVVAGCGGTDGPEEVTLEAMRGALADAERGAAEQWALVDAAHQAAGGQPDPAGARVALRLGCLGPLPVGYLAFGSLCDAEAEVPEHAERVVGQHMDQVRHAVGVCGERVESCSPDGGADGPIEVDDDAHAARVARHGAGAYYLIARFD